MSKLGKGMSCTYEFLGEKFQHAEYFYMVFISRTLAVFFRQCISKYTTDIVPNNNDIRINYKTKSKYKKICKLVHFMYAAIKKVGV